MNIKQKRRSAVVIILTLVILTMGTFAWQAFNQEALNVTEGAASNPGARLHDDFNGTDKMVYVENYTPVRFGGDEVYVRIRLDEYMEYVDTNDKGTVVLRGDVRNQEEAPSKEDSTTWDTYEFKTYSYSIPSEECIRNYRELNFGGRGDYTYYMPTFNMDSQDLDAEINGTIEGDYGTGDGSHPYNDYVKYSSTSHPDGITGTEVHYYNDDILYEEVLGYPVTPNADGLFTIENQNHKVHTTQELSGYCISMEDWNNLEYEDQIGDFWVYDTDGWAYYATGISYDTASGPLITSLDIIDNPIGNWFYGVNVVAQIASKGDWGIPENEGQEATGMYKDGVSESALELLNKAAGILKVLKIEITNNQNTIETDTIAGSISEPVYLSADVQVLNSVGTAGSDAVTWTIEEISEEKSGLSEYVINGKLVEGTFTPTLSMVGCTYKITVTSDLNTAMSDSVEVKVYRLDNVSLSAYSSNDWNLIQPGERMNSYAIMEGFDGDTSVTWSMYGTTHEDSTINANTGLVSISPEEELLDEEGNVKYITVRATSKELYTIYGEFDLELRVLADMNTLEYFYDLPLGDYYDSRVTIDGEEFFVMAEEEKNGRTALLLLAGTNLTSVPMHNHSLTTYGNWAGRWSTSDMRTTYLPAWLAQRPTLENQAALVTLDGHISYDHLYHTNYATVYYEDIPTDVTQDKAFLLSIDELYKYFVYPYEMPSQINGLTMLRYPFSITTTTSQYIMTRNIGNRGSGGATNNSGKFEYIISNYSSNATNLTYVTGSDYLSADTANRFYYLEIVMWVYL